MLPPPTQLNLSVAGSAEESVLVERLFRFGLENLLIDPDKLKVAKSAKLLSGLWKNGSPTNLIGQKPSMTLSSTTSM